jgi:hypothetical protein
MFKTFVSLLSGHASCVCVCVCVCMYVYIYIYIYIERERERERILPYCNFRASLIAIKLCANLL